jgi:hypothetical protein
MLSDSGEDGLYDQQQDVPSLSSGLQFKLGQCIQIFENYQVRPMRLEPLYISISDYVVDISIWLVCGTAIWDWDPLAAVYPVRNEYGDSKYLHHHEPQNVERGLVGTELSIPSD